MKIIKEFGPEHIFPYIAYVPETLCPHPGLIIQLHGAGERGNGYDDLDDVLVHGFGKIVTDDNLADSILIMPQCPTGRFWPAMVESIKIFIDQMIDLYSADPDRICLCGLSMGGFGTWYTAMAYPHTFAAIAPCCGGGMAWNAEVLCRMPIWTFHGMEDQTVSPNHTIEMIRALEGKNPYLKYDLYEGVGHNSWELAFTESLLTWLLQQKRITN